MKTLLSEALKLGVSGVELLDPENIPLDPDFALLCEEQRCYGFGQSQNCPPHGPTPADFKNLLPLMEKVLVFKFDIPYGILLTDDRHEAYVIIHETAAHLEKCAREMGFSRSRAFAGSSCKRVFCHAHSSCRVIGEGGTCRHPDQARPSMSGAGVNFLELTKAAGWLEQAKEKHPEHGSMGVLAGMVLLG